MLNTLLPTARLSGQASAPKIHALAGSVSSAGVHRAAESSFAGKRLAARAAESGRRTGVCVRSSRRAASPVLAMAGERMTVAVTGATGLVGSRLVSRLASEGHQIRVLTRNVEAAKGKFRGVPNVTYFGADQWAQGVAGSTAVVNLAGEPIANRWTPELKTEIKRSRVQATTRVVQAINAQPAASRPRVLVSSSAIGFYGASETASFDEDSRSGNDYLAEVCREWEAAALKAEVDRTVIVRTGIVLAREGGALAKMMPVFQLFAGGPLGSGRQWFSWIHREDLVGLIVEALKNSSFSGVVNGTAPGPVRMNEMCGALGEALGRPSWLPVPGFALQTLLGEGAQVVLDGQKVVPKRTLASGYKFKYSTIREAIRSLV